MKNTKCPHCGKSIKIKNNSIQPTKQNPGSKK